ncbi:MAG: DUF4428 domain-containing protein [Eubacteriales bacterium]|nr:DUF4428 domain-containing protein [Eubacteriales bacterium]
MGLFSKETCAVCGKQVGALSRTKMKSGDYICGDCPKKLTAFIQPNQITLDDYKRLVGGELQAAEDAYTGTSCFDVELGSGGDYGYMNYSSSVTNDEFRLSSSATRRYEHQQIFHFSQIKPYKFKSEATLRVEAMSVPTADLNDYVELVEDKDSDGKVKGYTIKFPYDDEAIQRVEIRANSNAKKQKLEELVKALNNGKRDFYGSAARYAQQQGELQGMNAMKTVNSMLGAALKGESVENALREGMERSEDIAQDKYKKGLFGGLFKKK